jgi:hypothetical protein
MRPIGFSTGALAKGDFRRALQMLSGKNTEVIELSALRQDELPSLLDSIPELDLSAFSYVSVHAPSSIQPGMEQDVTDQMRALLAREWPIIVHPDTIEDFSLWSRFGEQLCIENTDLRKSTGQTVPALEQVFSLLPQASFCCDLGHARQVDPTMSEATAMLRTFRSRLRQLHVSEVNARSHHDRLSLASISAFEKIYHLIPDTVPVILESPVSPEGIGAELANAREALPLQRHNLVLRAV